MTDRDADLMNKLSATGGWLERAFREATASLLINKDPCLYRAIIEAMEVNKEAIKILKREK